MTEASQTPNTYNPQGPTPATMGLNETSTAAVAAQAKALVESRYMVAFSRPRDLDVVRERLIKECHRPGFAKVARYKKPVGQGIEGPSIRFAEAALRCMGNIVIDTPTIFDDTEKRILQMSVTDLEANLVYSQAITVSKTVERKFAQRGDTVVRTRSNSKGETLYVIEASDDDILNKQNALISKAMRTLGLRMVPGDIVDEAMTIVIKVQRTADAQDPDAARRGLLDAFGGMGITVEQVKEYLGHDGLTFTPKELTDLRGIYAAIKDGEATWKEVMGNRPDPEGEKKPEGDKKPGSGSSLKDVLKGEAQGSAPSDATDPGPDAPAGAQAPAEAKNEGAPPPPAGDPWLSEPQKKLVFAKGKKLGHEVPVINAMIAALDGMGRDEGKKALNLIADEAEGSRAHWTRAVSSTIQG